MSVAFRRLPGVVARMVAGLLLAHPAAASVVLDAEEAAPAFLARNVPDPQLGLTLAIVLLFAGSLTILLVGYVADSTRPHDQSLTRAVAGSRGAGGWS